MITNEQREARKLGIGGSDMPIILGLSTYKTPYQLYLEKIGELSDNNEETEVQYWGNRLEGTIREEFEIRNNVKVSQPDTLVHADYSFLRGNLDGFIEEQNAVLEIKCANQFMSKEWGDDSEDAIPMPYLVQVAIYCAIANADYAYIAVLIGGNTYKQYKYTRDLALETHLIEKAKEFWSCVENRTPPEPINQIDLRLMFPKHDPEKTKTISKPLAEQLTTLAETRFKIKALSEIEEQHKFNIMQFMEDAECLVNEEGQPLITWKANKRGSRTFLMKGI